LQATTIVANVIVANTRPTFEDLSMVSVRL